MDTKTMSGNDMAHDAQSCDLSPGTISPDETAIVGKDGQLFLYKGSNNLINQYGPDDTVHSSRCAAQWCGLIETRAKRMQRLGSGFVQTIIPDPPSLLADKFPIPIEGPTRSLRGIEHEL